MTSRRTTWQPASLLATPVVWVRDTAASFGASSGRVRASLRAAPSTPKPYDGKFRNAEPDTPLRAFTAVTLLAGFVRHGTAGRPLSAIPVEQPVFPEPAADLAVTWLGHATALMEVDGRRVLADPMFSDRASPASVVGPKRLHPSPVTAAELPALDAILISHDHYDHLDRSTILALAASSAAPFVVPLGVGAHLRRWGVPATRIVELAWGEAYRLGTLTLTCVRARHFSGRGLTRNATLWSSWAIVGPEHRVFFGGDTGVTTAFSETGECLGPFDLTIMPIGAYDDAWPDVHLTPEQAVAAHHELRGAALFPIHWATFDLALHSWAEPIERLLAAATGETVLTPPPGRRVVVNEPTSAQFWWRQLRVSDFSTRRRDSI